MNNDIKYNLDNIDITNIIKQIHANIKSNGYDMEELKKRPETYSANSSSSTPLLCQSLDKNVASVNSSNFIKYWWEMPKEDRFFLKLKTIFDKVTRKFSYFYIKQVFDQQNTYNANMTRCINDLSDYCKQLEAEKNVLATKIDSLKIEVDNLKLESKGID